MISSFEGGAPFQGWSLVDQKTLRELESRCIQEEPPPCTAACPLHVDVRLFLRRIAEGKWEEARKTLDRTLPLTGILGRICDHPCQLPCRRGEAGEPIEIGRLEKACVRTTARRERIQRLPGRDRRVGVVGSGLSGLTAAWDLARKGYEVYLLCPGERPGDTLWDLPREVLPGEAIAEEVSLLEQLGVKTELRVKAGREMLDAWLERFDALCVDLRAMGESPPFLDGLDVQADRETLEAGRQGLFLAGLSRGADARSPVLDAAEGRKAATSIDRWLQGVSLRAGREKEGPFSTRLYTSLEGVVPLPAVTARDPLHGYDSEEAGEEARRCLHCECLECVKVCLYLERFGAYPRRYAREIYNNESIVMGHRKANRLINSCSLCRLCEVVCPEDFSMADLCRDARRSMVERDKMPLSAHEFALQDMLFSTGEHFALCRHQPGRAESAYLFFPGCQLCASAPEQVEGIYGYLCGQLPGGVGLMLNCCGAPADWAAREDLSRDLWETLREQWHGLGRPRLILACSTCASRFKQQAPEVETESLWETLVRIGLPPSASTAGAGGPASAPLVLHDPCTSRGEEKMQQSVRSLLQALGCATEELMTSRSLTECCGFGGLMANANPSLARDVARRRAEQSPLDFVAYCAMCRDNLAAAGKRTLHILDLIWPPATAADPADRKGPGWSQRRENRARLKRRMLARLWNERTESMRACEDMTLHIPADVQERMEERRILDEDVKRVIEFAERSGRRLANRHTGRFLAYHKPVRVTFWVEYSKEDDGYAVHNVYSHRMEILERIGS